MRAVVQRVRCARVSVGRELISSIGPGFCVFVGVSLDDSQGDIAYLASKLAGLRVFEDSTGKMNLAIRDIGGEILLVSQFTLFGDVRHGNRPSFTRAAPPDMANRIFEDLTSRLRGISTCEVKTGRFRSHMAVELTNDGPVTILIDSKKDF